MDVTTLNSVVAATALIVAAIFGGIVQRYIARGARESNKYSYKLETYRKLNKVIVEIEDTVDLCTCLMFSANKDFVVFSGPWDSFEEMHKMKARDQVEIRLMIPEKTCIEAISSIDEALLITVEETRNSLNELRKLLVFELSMVRPHGKDEQISYHHGPQPNNEEIFQRINSDLLPGTEKEVKIIIKEGLERSIQIENVCKKVQKLMARELS